MPPELSLPTEQSVLQKLEELLVAGLSHVRAELSKFESKPSVAKQVKEKNYGVDGTDINPAWFKNIMKHLSDEEGKPFLKSLYHAGMTVQQAKDRMGISASRVKWWWEDWGFDVPDYRKKKSK